MSTFSPAPIPDELTYCEVHPDRETALRCNKCGRLMCADCAVSTPVGYRCKQCIRSHENKFFTASLSDEAIIFAVCAVLAGVGGWLISQAGLGLWLGIIVGLPAGGLLAEVGLRAVKRRRGRYSGEVAAAAVVVGGLLGAGIRWWLFVQNAYGEALQQLPEAQRQAAAAQLPGISLGDILGYITSDIGLLLFIGLVAFAVYGRFKMKR